MAHPYEKTVSKNYKIRDSEDSEISILLENDNEKIGIIAQFHWDKDDRIEAIDVYPINGMNSLVKAVFTSHNTKECTLLFDADPYANHTSNLGITGTNPIIAEGCKINIEVMLNLIGLQDKNPKVSGSILKRP